MENQTIIQVASVIGTGKLNLNNVRWIAYWTNSGSCRFYNSNLPNGGITVPTFATVLDAGKGNVFERISFKGTSGETSVIYYQ